MTQFNEIPKIEPLPPLLITILGPTATGKTSLGVALAEKFGGEIVSADSRQVYKGMDIGTGKDLDEYGNLRHHLIDIVEPGYEYNLFEFVRDFTQAFENINQRGKLPFLVGGTGMYLDAILNRYQLTFAHKDDLSDQSDEALKNRLIELRPQQHNTTDLLSRTRLIQALQIAIAEENNAPIIQAPEAKYLTLGMQFPREHTRKRITTRLKERLDSGMIEEVQHLNDNGLGWEQLDFYGLEYRYIGMYLQNKLSYNDMYQKLNSAIHQFAKQQEKWFRNIEKKGHDIKWLDMEGDLVSQSSVLIEDLLQQKT